MGPGIIVSNRLVMYVAGFHSVTAPWASLATMYQGRFPVGMSQTMASGAAQYLVPALYAAFTWYLPTNTVMSNPDVISWPAALATLMSQITWSPRMTWLRSTHPARWAIIWTLKVRAGAALMPIDRKS